MRILIVEDDPVSMLVLNKALQKLGHEVVEAENGQLAWEILQTQFIEVMITDWMLPELDGLELTRRVRSTSEAGSYLYIILLSAKNQREDRIDALRHGADDLLSKPLDSAELIARLDVAFRIRQLQTELKQQADDLGSISSVLEMANRRVVDMFRGLPIPCMTIDHETRIMEWNAAAETLYGLQAGQVYLQPLANIIVGDEDKSAAWDLAGKALEGGFIDSIEWDYPQKSGIVRNLLVSTYPLRDRAGSIVGAGISYVDITERKKLEGQLANQLDIATELNESLERKGLELKEANSKLEQLARTDGLTGLNNRRSFGENLQSMLEIAKAQETPLSVVLLDVDKFKTFNDTYGHPAGDEVLRQVAELLQSTVRKNMDIVARYGGEEFVLVLPGADQQAAYRIAEKARKAIAEANWPLRQVTASFGISTLGPDCGDAEMLTKYADEALYASKENGRNQVTHHEQIKHQAA